MGLFSDRNLFLLNAVNPLKDGRKSKRATSLSSTAAGLLRDFLKSSSGALNFKKSLCRQGIGFRRCCFRSFASAHCMSAVLRKTTEPVGSVHFLNVVRERLVQPRFTGLSAREARLATPYGQDRHGSIPLTLHCVRTRPAGKEVRLRLVLFDARFIHPEVSSTSFPTPPPRASGNARL